MPVHPLNPELLELIAGLIHYAIGDPRLYTLCDLMCDQVRTDALARQEAVA